MESFLQYIQRYTTLSTDSIEHLRQLAKIETIDKGTLLIEEGKICKRLYFLTHGTIRTFFYLNGKDITHWIYPENNMITSWHSYILQSLLLNI